MSPAKLAAWGLVAAAAIVTLVVLVMGLAGAGTGSSSFSALPAPVRLLDTRTSGGPMPGGSSVRECISPGANAVALNLTVTEPWANGYVTAYPSGQDRPPTSNLNFAPGQTVANYAIVGLGPDGCFVVYVFGTAQLIVDWTGTFWPAA